MKNYQDKKRESNREFCKEIYQNTIGVGYRGKSGMVVGILLLVLTGLQVILQ